MRILEKLNNFVYVGNEFFAKNLWNVEKVKSIPMSQNPSNKISSEIFRTMQSEKIQVHWSAANFWDVNDPISSIFFDTVYYECWLLRYTAENKTSPATQVKWRVYRELKRFVCIVHLPAYCKLNAWNLSVSPD